MNDDVMTLISRSDASYDSYGNPVVAEETKDVFCKVRSVSRSEFYQAAQTGLQPSFVFTISHPLDYEGQTIIKYRDQYYNVIRTYYASDAVELTAELRIREYGEDSE